MAYNTRAIKTDLNNRPIPQYFNPVVDDYEALQGENGANRVLLWGSNNQPLLTETNAGYVRAADGALATIGALADAAQTSPTAEASVVALLKGVLTRLQAGADGAAPSDVVDRAARELGRISAVDGAIAALGTLADAAVTDPATSGAVIGLLKGLLQTLQGSPNVTLSGSFATLRPMTGGSMTVAGTAAEIAPGTTGRRGLWLRNEEDAIRVRIDGAGITDQTGAPMEPGEVAILGFDPAVFVPVYVISEAGLARLDYNWW